MYECASFAGCYRGIERRHALNAMTLSALGIAIAANKVSVHRYTTSKQGECAPVHYEQTWRTTRSDEHGTADAVHHLAHDRRLPENAVT
jgi:hypothetical protein